MEPSSQTARFEDTTSREKQYLDWTRESPKWRQQAQQRRRTAQAGKR